MWKPIILDVECIVCKKSLQKINHITCETPLKMRKATNRRSRTPNWSLDEKQYLLDLIKERKEVVVAKNNNGPNYSEEKEVAWNEILRELAARFGNKFSDFSIKKVKTQWQNMKRIAREEMSQMGTEMQKYTRQSLEVHNILDTDLNGPSKKDDESINGEILDANIEIKAESIDEEESVFVDNINEADKTNNNNAFESSALSTPEQISKLIEEEISDINLVNNNITKRNVSAMTEMSLMDRFNFYPFHTDVEDFFKYSKMEKELKLDTLKEERQAVRARREAAELNKIIAEKKLKHILWIEEAETGMYSGEPGSGAGKGGGTGGAIRDAGGSFGKMQAAREEEYFYKKQKEQLANMKGMLSQEIAFHEDQIKRHEDAIRRHKEQMAKMDDK